MKMILLWAAWFVATLAFADIFVRHGIQCLRRTERAVERYRASVSEEDLPRYLTGVGWWSVLISVLWLAMTMAFRFQGDGSVLAWVSLGGLLLLLGFLLWWNRKYSGYWIVRR